MSRFNPEIADQLVAEVEAGCSLAAAAEALELPLPTFKTWMQKGRRDPAGRYGNLAARVDAARQKPIREQAAADMPAMTDAEFRRHVEAAIRLGSTGAMRLFASLYIADDGKPDARQLLGLDRK